MSTYCMLIARSQRGPPPYDRDNETGRAVGDDNEICKDGGRCVYEGIYSEIHGCGR